MRFTQEELLEQGWSKQLLSLFDEDIAAQSQLTVGLPLFKRLWQRSAILMVPKERLRAFLNLIAMPSELTGKRQQNQRLVDKFSMTLSPDDPFWYDFASLVSRVFPEDCLSQSGQLQRRVHQLRYIISSHQAQYVRRHFKQTGMTDGDALACYLKGKKRQHLWCRGEYSVDASARLHNKIALRKGDIRYPDDRLSANIKILIGFHTEFILDSQGNFLNETDYETITESGIVNGASFNYGTEGKRHWQLDVDPVRRHDPLFRQEMTRHFRAPNRSRRWPCRQGGDYDLSYFNPRGKYSYHQQSSYQRVKQAAKAFKQAVKKA